jgi:hypothetical protein
MPPFVRILQTLVLAWMAAGFCPASFAATPDLADLFADRPSSNDSSGSARGNNSGASVEPFEPRHGGKVGGRSVWMSWTAPASGIATFETTGSSFDTLLSVYSLDAGNPDKPALDRLRDVARADDNGSGLDSMVQFGVRAGQTYEIAVDGFRGASGEIRLRWDLLALERPPPVILQVPPDRALRTGDPVVLTVDIQAGDDVKLAWFFNGNELFGVDSGATLTIPSFHAGNVGRYQLRITADSVRFFSTPIELQINSEGEIATLARDKLFDAIDSPLIGRGDDPEGRGALARPSTANSRRLAAIGVSRGYNGVQIFNTLYAAREPDEPAHCGVSGGASYWLAYQAPASGSLVLDTQGSSFDTVLAVYTYEEPLTGFSSLVPVACDNNSGPDGLTSRLSFETVAGRPYLMVVDGVNGARGSAHLNYRLTTVAPPSPPILLQSPAPLTVVQGQPAAFEVRVDGSPPLAFQWFKDGSPLDGATLASLTFAAVQPSDAAAYSVRVSNAAGALTSAPVALSVLIPPSLLQSPAPLTVVQGQPATFEVRADGSPPLAFQWFKDGSPLDGATLTSLAFAAVQPSDAAAYSVRVSNAAGALTSAPVALSVLIPPSLLQTPAPLTVVQGQPAAFEVRVDGSPPLAFQWFKDGSPLDGATLASLAFAAVQPSDAAAYSVRVSNAAGALTSAPVALSVLVPPSLLQSPAPLTVVQGQPATFEVHADGSAPLAFQWFKDGSPLDGATLASLAFGAVQPSDAAAYSVRVSNAAGAITSAPVALSVLIPPSFLQSPVPLMVVQGTPASLRVEATGSPSLHYQWSKDGRVLAGATQDRLEWAAIRPVDAGVYRVVISNDAGQIESSAVTVAVQVASSIAFETSSRSVRLEVDAFAGQSYTVEEMSPEPASAWTVVQSGVAEGERISVRLPVGEIRGRLFRFLFRPAGSGAAAVGKGSFE